MLNNCDAEAIAAKNEEKYQQFKKKAAKRIHECSDKSRQNNSIGNEDLSKLADELMELVGTIQGFGFVNQLYLMIKSRAEAISQIPDKVTALLEHATRIIDHYEKGMAIRFINEYNGKILHEEAVQLFLRCNVAMETCGYTVRKRDKLRTKFGLFVHAYNYTALIDECNEMLTAFLENLMLVDRSRSRSNVLPHVEGKTVGLHDHYRFAEITSFLKKGCSEKEIGVVYLYGAKGVGKSRILHELLRHHKDYMKLMPSDYYKLYIPDCSHTGESSDRGRWPTLWQDKLLEQIVDGVTTEGLASKDVGKQKILDCINFLKMQENVKIILAIDNISEDGLLGDLLPGHFADFLPPGSCVIVSVEGNHGLQGAESRVYKDVQTTLRGSSSQCVFKAHQINSLPLPKARELFARFCPLIPKDESIQSDVDNLITRCDGLPLLLQCFGKYFGGRDKNQPPASFWQKVCEELVEADDKCKRKWQEKLDEIDEWTKDEVQRQKKERDAQDLLTMSKLTLLYRLSISEDLQMSMGDCANLFNGWCKETVDNIMGKQLMSGLARAIKFEKKSSPAKLPLIADITRAYAPDSLRTLTVVSVPPETLWTAREMYHEMHVQAVASPLPRVFQRLDVSGSSHGVEHEYRSLCLIDCQGDFQMQWIEKLNGLRYIILHRQKEIIGTSVRPLKDLRYLHFGADNKHKPQKFPFRAEHLQNLKCLSLSDFDFASSVFQVPPLLEMLSLIKCRHLVQAFQNILGSKTIKTLHIRSCEGVQALTARHRNTGIHNLSFQLCYDLDPDNLPQFVLELVNLAKLNVLSCSCKEVSRGTGSCPLTPSGSVNQATQRRHENLKHLFFNDCRNMTDLPADVRACGSLTVLDLDTCNKLERLPAQIDRFTVLESLNLTWCVCLEALPPQIGALRALKSLTLVACSRLKALPNEIGQLKSLETLKMDYCETFTTLPEELAVLESLTYLSMSWCKGLKHQIWIPNLSKLPKKLNYLNLTGLDSKLSRDCVIDLSICQRLPVKLVNPDPSRLWNGKKKVYPEVNADTNRKDEKKDERLLQSEVFK
ncbi:hypothetical protein Mapa_006723 [Marchantia paleacea]|nr:hypothetical protein Mapa_006723 [Marchantia paleacea]